MFAKYQHVTTGVKKKIIIEQLIEKLCTIIKDAKFLMQSYFQLGYQHPL